MHLLYIPVHQQLNVWVGLETLCTDELLYYTSSMLLTFRGKVLTYFDLNSTAIVMHQAKVTGIGEPENRKHR